MGRTQRLALITAAGLAVIAITYFIAIRAITSVTRTRAENVLTTIRDTTLDTLLLSMSQVRGQVTGWANSSAVIAETEQLLENPTVGAQAMLASTLAPASMEDHFQGFFLVDRSNKVLASSLTEEVGKISLLVEHSNYFITLFSRETSFISIPVKQTSTSVDRAIILAGAPIRDSQGHVIAGLVFYIDPLVDFSRILQNGRLLNTGETYAVNSNGLLVSNSRFDDQLQIAGIIGANEASILNVFIKDPGVDLIDGAPGAINEGARVFTRMATSLLLHQTSSDIDGYRDYRGVEVVGAWTWNEEFEFGIATEVDKEEAFSNVASVKPAILLLSLLSGGALVGTVVLSNFADQRERLAQKRHELTVEGAMDAIISFDSADRITSWNSRAENMFGWKKNEAMGKSLATRILPDELKLRYFRRLQQLQDEKEDLFSVQRREFELKRRDGSSFPSEFFIIPYELGSEKGFSAFIRDITDIREAEKQIERSHAELAESYDATLRGWSSALDLRDNETEGHTQRVTEQALRLAEVLGISKEEQLHIYRGSLLHDIGKIGVPDRILLKPGPLDDEEWVVMKLHPVHAYNFLNRIPYLRPALDIPHHHHEKWDGSGYPDKLASKAIPYAARMFAVVDVWDALTSDRPYRKAWSAERARDLIKEQRGKHFDPDVADAFLDLVS